MELIFVVLLLFANKMHKNGFSHFSGPNQKEIFFYNPSLQAEILIGGYSTGIRGSGFLNFPMHQEALQLQVLEDGQMVFEQNYRLQDQFMMIFIPETKKSHLKRVLP